MILFWPLLFRFAESLLLQDKIVDFTSLEYRSLNYFAGARSFLGEEFAANIEMQLRLDTDVPQLQQYYQSYQQRLRHGLILGCCFFLCFLPPSVREEFLTRSPPLPNFFGQFSFFSCLPRAPTASPTSSRESSPDVGDLFDSNDELSVED